MLEERRKKDLFAVLPPFLPTVVSVQSCLTLCDPLELSRLLCTWDFSVKNTGVIVISFSRQSCQPRDQTWVSCIAGGFFTHWALRKALASSQSRGTMIGFVCSGKWLCTVVKLLTQHWQALSTAPACPPCGPATHWLWQQTWSPGHGSKHQNHPEPLLLFVLMQSPKSAILKVPLKTPKWRPGFMDRLPSSAVTHEEVSPDVSSMQQSEWVQDSFRRHSVHLPVTTS